MDANAKKGVPGRTPTPVSGSPSAPSASAPSSVSSKMRTLVPAKPVSVRRPAPPPINMPRGTAVPLPNVPNVPAGVRPVSGPQAAPMQPPRRRISGQHILCSRCSMPMSAEDIQQGDGQLLNGVPTCKICLRKAAERARAARSFKLGVLSAACAAVAAAVFFPSQMLFVAVIVSVLTAICGVLGFTWAVKTRVVVVTCGVLFAATGILVLQAMSRQDLVQAQSSDFVEEAREVQQLIEADQIADAETRLNALAARADNGKGGYVSGNAQAAVEQTRNVLNERIRSKHGEVGGREREVLMFLGTAYPDRPNEGARFRDVKVESTTLKMTVMLNEEPLNGCIMDELKDVPFALFDIFPKLDRIDARCVSPGGGEAGAIQLERDKAASIRTKMTPTSGLPIQAEAMKALENPASTTTAR